MGKKCTCFGSIHVGDFSNWLASSRRPVLLAVNLKFWILCPSKLCKQKASASADILMRQSLMHSQKAWPWSAGWRCWDVNPRFFMHKAIWNEVNPFFTQWRRVKPIFLLFFNAKYPSWAHGGAVATSDATPRTQRSRYLLLTVHGRWANWGRFEMTRKLPELKI